MTDAPPDAAELLAAVREGVARRHGEGRRVTGVRRRPFAYRTSFPVEEVDAALDDGSTVSLVLKSLGRDALTEDARRAKPAFLHDPEREIEVYRSVLPEAPPGPPALYGSAVDSGAGRYWLLLERVAGRELYQVGEVEVWREVARWLGRFHARFAGPLPPPSARLLAYDAAFYRVWPRRAVAFSRGPARRELERLAGRYERVVERLLALPTTLLHGEFYASNVIAVEGSGGVRVCPVDWELAGRGPGLIDLSALTAGRWTDAERADLVRAYHAGLAAEGTVADLSAALDWCRLHLAVQWVGWSHEWVPPAEHAHDWLGEALGLADRLGL